MGNHWLNPPHSMILSHEMIPRLIALILVVAVPVASGQKSTEDSTGSAVSANSKKQKTAADRPVIGLGMTPEEIVKVIGKPEKTEMVETPAGKGEEWIYRRLAKEWTQQSAATVDIVPAFVGLAMPNEGIGDVASVSNRLERIEVFQVSRLLFIDGKLAAAKQWQEKVSRIEN